MQLTTTENQTMITQAVRDLVEREVRPNLMDWDERQYFPKELFTQHFGPAGMLGVFVPEEYGGAGMGYHEYVDTIVEVARVCGSIGLSVAAHNSLCTGHINYFGDHEQKQRWLTKLATGEWVGAWALTEPNTGSDAMRMKCTAKKDGKVRVMFKELPILGPESVFAARAALAAQRQGKYIEYHLALMRSRERLTDEITIRIAQGVGIDLEKLKKDRDHG